MGSVQQFQHLLRRARDHRAVPPDHHGALHQLRVLQKEGDHLLTRLVVFLREAELLVVLVLADEVRQRVGQEVQEMLERRAVERIGEVFDDVARDVALTQDVQRAAGLPSTGVVVDEELFHGAGA